MSGENVKPQVFRYEGAAPAARAIRARFSTRTSGPSSRTTPATSSMSSDGTTLLGADDKAGVAEIMAAVAYLVRHPDVPHGTVRIAFTPDEEIGRGVDNFDVAAFGAEVAYTLDGSDAGQIQDETFSALEARALPRARGAPRLREGHPRERDPARRRLRRRAPARALAREDRGARGLHPPHAHLRLRRERRGAADPPRLRRGEARELRRARPQDRRARSAAPRSRSGASTGT